MSKILAVFGATGTQGSSVVNHVLNDPQLSQQFKIRAITRDVKSEKAQQLKNKAEVVAGDIADRASIEAALTGVQTVFIMNTPAMGPDAFEAEYKSITGVADIAVAKGVEYIIFSTLPYSKEISGGKFFQATMFDAKAAAERYIRGLPVKSAFVSLGSFMENFHTQPFLNPRPAPDGTWVMARNSSPKTPFPLIDATSDTGKFVGAILAEPGKFEGKRFCAAEKIYTFEEIAAVLAKATGKTVVYKQISTEEFKESLSMLPPPLIEVFGNYCNYIEEFGYFGPGEDKEVAWAVQNVKGKLATFEEFLERNPVQLG